MFEDKDGKFYDDNDERMIFFCKGALETVKKLGWAPDIIHCHGWMSALVPAYLKTTYKDDPTFKNSKVVYSIYEDDKKDNASFLDESRQVNLAQKLPSHKFVYDYNSFAVSSLLFNYLWNTSVRIFGCAIKLFNCRHENSAMWLVVNWKWK